MNQINNMKAKTTCDWCLQEAPVEIIRKKLWDFWKTVSKEDPNVDYKNICASCKSRYEEFATYIESCKNNASIVDAVLSAGNIKHEPLMDFEYHPIKILKEEPLDPDYSTGSSQLKSDLPNSDKPFKCTFCRKTFSRSSTLKVHLRVHTGYKPFNCTQCEQSFYTAGYLKIHSRLHAAEKVYKCSQCNKRFSSFVSSKIHLNLHTGEKPYRCSECVKRFSAPRSLKVHYFSAHKDKLLTCSRCGKCFSTFRHLKNHLKVHNNKKCFKCSCNRYFPTYRHLKNHIFFTHVGKMPYKCFQCDKYFSMCAFMKDHYLLVHAGQAFKCERCDKCFSIMFTMRKTHNYYRSGFI